MTQGAGNPQQASALSVEQLAELFGRVNAVVASSLVGQDDALQLCCATLLVQGHALLRLENCICTPHIGYVELDSYELYFGAAFDNVVNFIRGTPTNIVNPGALQVRR